jgi:hypothetical protein
MKTFNKYESRYFNNVLEKNGIIEKSSSNKQKIINEYNYYYHLPENIKKYFVQPKNLKIFDNLASYEMEKIDIKNLGELSSLYSISENSFYLILKNIKNFQEDCIIYGEIDLCETKDSYDLVINKTFGRIQNNQLLFLLFDRLNNAYSEYIKNRTTWKKIISHGDLCFSNILWSEEKNIFNLIDPRGAKIKKDIYIDEYYDLAKLSHSVLGGYDSIIYNGNPIKKEVQDMFIQYIYEKDISFELLRVYEASLFLSMIPLHNKNIALFVKQCDKILIDLGF